LIATGEAGAPASPSIITLTTDFGARDPYVGEMKGVILAIAAACRRTVQIVDITHEVARHDVVEGALALEAAAGVFPAATVHVAVVDPGVGTARRALALAARGQVFVAPDNGLVTPCLDAGWQAVALEAAEYRRRTVSRTFHGRDVFAPAAAHVALGLALDRLGPPLADPVRLPWDDAYRRGGVLEGAVLHVDRFGNLVTTVREAQVTALGAAATVRIAGRPVPLVGTYGDLRRGQAGALIGSTGRLEIAVREGSAAARLRARRGTPVVVSPSTSRSRRRA
jgi:S-adenosylmethionine hydrolase